MRKKKLFSFSGRIPPSCFRSFPPDASSPPSPWHPRRALVGRFLPEAHHRDSAARRDGRRPERPPPWRTSRGTTRRGPKICTPRWSATGSRRGSSRRTPACFGTSRGSRSSGSRGWTRARPARARRGPSSIGVPRQDARPRRRAFRATQIERVDQRRQDVARRSERAIRRAVRFRRGCRAETRGGVGADARRGFRGAARAPQRPRDGVPRRERGARA